MRRLRSGLPTHGYCYFGHEFQPEGVFDVPAPSVTSTDPKEQAAIDKVKIDADTTLQAQLDAIAAEYGLSREQLDAEGGEIGRQWQFAKAELIRNAFNQQESTINSMIERGILKSGLTVQGTLENERAEESGRNVLDADRAVSLADIAARRAALGPQEKAAAAVATADHQAQLRDLELMQAAYGQPASSPSVTVGVPAAAKPTASSAAAESGPAVGDWSNVKKTRQTATRY